MKVADAFRHLREEHFDWFGSLTEDEQSEWDEYENDGLVTPTRYQELRSDSRSTCAHLPERPTDTIEATQKLCVRVSSGRWQELGGDPKLLEEWADGVSWPCRYESVNQLAAALDTTPEMVGAELFGSASVVATPARAPTTVGGASHVALADPTTSHSGTSKPFSLPPLLDQGEELTTEADRTTSSEGHFRATTPGSAELIRAARWLGALSDDVIAFYDQVSDWTWGTAPTSNQDLGQLRLNLFEAVTAEHGTTLVPQWVKLGDVSAWEWLHKIRKRHATGDISMAAQRRLESLPEWTWDHDRACTLSMLREVTVACAIARLSGDYFDLTTEQPELPSHMPAPERSALASWLLGKRRSMQHTNLPEWEIVLFERVEDWEWCTKEQREAANLAEAVHHLLRYTRVPERLRIVLEQRILRETQERLAAIAGRLDLSREAVRQIETRGIAMALHPVNLLSRADLSRWKTAAPSTTPPALLERAVGSAEELRRTLQRNRYDHRSVEDFLGPGGEHLAQVIYNSLGAGTHPREIPSGTVVEAFTGAESFLSRTKALGLRTDEAVSCAPRSYLSLCFTDDEVRALDEILHETNLRQCAHGVTSKPLVQPPAPGTSIDNLLLSTRAYNALRRSGIATLEDLCAMSTHQLLLMPNFGMTCLHEVEQKLARLGCTLRESATEPATNDSQSQTLPG